MSNPPSPIAGGIRTTALSCKRNPPALPAARIQPRGNAYPPMKKDSGGSSAY
jgi:hypothetical protein